MVNHIYTHTEILELYHQKVLVQVKTPMKEMRIISHVTSKKKKSLNLSRNGKISEGNLFPSLN